MGQDQNLFGGGNPNGLYVPLTPDEQDAIQRASELGVQVRITELGIFPAHTVTIGDHRVTVQFRVLSPTGAVLEKMNHQVETTTGIVLVRDQISCIQNGSPLMILAGEPLEMELHISISHISPEFLRRLRPAHTGQSTRRVDTHTGEFTQEGNMRNLTDQQRKLLQTLHG